jgi:hydroxymethylbilane synthase
MKDVPVVPAQGIIQAAVLPRASALDLLVCKDPHLFEDPARRPVTIATGSIRRRAQWLHRYPADTVVDLRGNINTRLHHLAENDWDGAIFAAAGLERTGLRPGTSFELDWMLPAPAQGAIMVVCREGDGETARALAPLNDAPTALCTFIEREFLSALMGGCSTPISAYARIESGDVLFEGNVLTTDGKDKLSVEKKAPAGAARDLGKEAGKELLDRGAGTVLAQIRAAGIR